MYKQNYNFIVTIMHCLISITIVLQFAWEIRFVRKTHFLNINTIYFAILCIINHVIINHNFVWQAIGNHEFDDGPEVLAPYLSHLKAPALAANMEVSQEPLLQGLFQSSIVVEKKGRKIGIIGLVTQETAVN